MVHQLWLIIISNKRNWVINNMNIERTVYLDHAATTAVHPDVLAEMLPYFTENFGNPSSIYSVGRTAHEALDVARHRVATGINAYDKEIYFTASGSEADNWALKGVALANQSKGKHIISTCIEHPAILNTLKYLEKNEGFDVTRLPVDENGYISLTELESNIRQDTVLVTIMFANNEIGTVQPIAEIGEICRKHDVIFHTDAVQALGAVPIDVQKLNVDLMSMSSHKIYGPKGVGCLYIRKGINVSPLVHGGHQERGKRAGTENLSGIVGFGKAVELACSNIEENIKYLSELRDYTKELIESRISHIKFNGGFESRLPGNLNVSIRYIEGESILLMLDMHGICASSGSACTSGSLDPSHVLLAIGLPHEIAHGSVRISLGLENTREDVEYFVDVLETTVNRLREMSPLWKKGE